MKKTVVAFDFGASSGRAILGMLGTDPADGKKKLELEEGQFAIFYPWEVHRPNCQFADSPEQVKKVVVKVRA